MQHPLSHGLRQAGAIDPARSDLSDEGQAEGAAERIDEHGFPETWMPEKRSAFLAAVLDKLPATVFIKDAVTRTFVYGNQSALALAGRPRSACFGLTDPEMFPELGYGYEEREAMVLNDPSAHTHESDFLNSAGEVIRLRTKRMVLDVPGHEHRYIIGLSEDVTETRWAQAQILRLAQFDSLTGLQNRHYFIDCLSEVAQSKQPFALLSIDLDSFKSVNDQHGHLIGDDVLSCIGDRIRRAIRPGDSASRVGGDEFAIIVIDEDPAGRARQIWQDLLPELRKPIYSHGVATTVGASVGIAIGPIDSDTAEGIRQCADLALYRSKGEGRNRANFFCVALDAAASERQELERDLMRALHDDEITVAYQPVISTLSGQITSVEALARWTHSDRGVIPPTVFIAIAEQSGLIESLGNQVLRLACEAALEWPDHVAVAVNVSPIQIFSRSFLNVVESILQETGLPHHRLQLEITESLFINNVEQAVANLRSLKSLGIKILMDDFGTGYSSLSYFEMFDFDKVKIDKTFVDKANISRSADAIIKAVIGLGKSLNMAVVAEGVETVEQMEALASAGCTHLQGYLFCKPMSASCMKALLAQGGLGDALPGTDAAIRRAS